MARRLQPLLILVEQLVRVWVALEASRPQRPWYSAHLSAGLDTCSCRRSLEFTMARTLLLDAVPRSDRASAVFAPQAELAVGDDGEAFWFFAMPRDAVFLPVGGLQGAYIRITEPIRVGSACVLLDTRLLVRFELWPLRNLPGTRPTQMKTVPFSR